MVSALRNDISNGSLQNLNAFLTEIIANQHTPPGAKHLVQLAAPSEKSFSGKRTMRKIQPESLAGLCAQPWVPVTRNLAQVDFPVIWESEEELVERASLAEVLTCLKKHGVGQGRGKEDLCCVWLTVTCSEWTRGRLELKQHSCARGSRAANGRAGEWGSWSHARLTHEPLVRGKRGWETSGMGHECSNSNNLGLPAMEVVKERV